MSSPEFPTENASYHSFIEDGNLFKDFTTYLDSKDIYNLARTNSCTLRSVQSAAPVMRFRFKAKDVGHCRAANEQKPLRVSPFWSCNIDLSDIDSLRKEFAVLHEERTRKAGRGKSENQKELDAGSQTSPGKAIEMLELKMNCSEKSYYTRTCEDIVGDDEDWPRCDFGSMTRTVRNWGYEAMETCIQIAEECNVPTIVELDVVHCEYRNIIAQLRSMGSSGRAPRDGDDASPIKSLLLKDVQCHQEDIHTRVRHPKLKTTRQTKTTTTTTGDASLSAEPVTARDGGPCRCPHVGRSKEESSSRCCSYDPQIILHASDRTFQSVYTLPGPYVLPMKNNEEPLVTIEALVEHTWRLITRSTFPLSVSIAPSPLYVVDFSPTFPIRHQDGQGGASASDVSEGLEPWLRLEAKSRADGWSDEILHFLSATRITKLQRRQWAGTCPYHEDVLSQTYNVAQESSGN